MSNSQPSQPAARAHAAAQGAPCGDSHAHDERAWSASPPAVACGSPAHERAPAQQHAPSSAPDAAGHVPSDASEAGDAEHAGLAANDHRRLGRELDLFSVDQRVGQGMILWHPKGAAIRQAIEAFESALLLKHGYDVVYSPHVVNEELLRISGHLDHYADDMFPAAEIDGVRYRPKPMNCPGHSCIYQSRPRSYRDLPLRFAEFGAVYRYEQSGALHGLMRVRGFVQDDAHIFCRPDQVVGEVHALLDLIEEMLAAFGYAYEVELSSRPVVFLGAESAWDWAESLLAGVMHERGVPCPVDVGGGAFYGPKLDFKLVDAHGRRWQGPTVQLDFNLPERFALEYMGEDNQKHRPAMLHRVLVGSMERFVGVLLEHCNGALPLWLAPEQLVVLPIGPDQEVAAAAFVAQARARGIRAVVSGSDADLRDRIIRASLGRVPYVAVIGAREAAAGDVSVRVRGGGRQSHLLSEFELLGMLSADIAARRLDLRLA